MTTTTLSHPNPLPMGEGVHPSKKRKERKHMLFKHIGIWVLVVSGFFFLQGSGTVLGAEPESIKTSSGLQYVDLVTGDGREAHVGETAFVHYTGWLEDGTKFDSSVDRGEPFSFRLGAGQVIKGWDEGVVGMRIGTKRKLIIPPGLGYGSRGAGRVIPPNATLIFEVELLDLR